MKIRILIFGLITLTLLGLTSCSSVILGLYGMKEGEVVDEDMIGRYAKKYRISAADNFELDTAYFSYLFSFDKDTFGDQIKNHFQPLQALYFDNSGQLKSYQVNCYAGGFPNLKWNRNGTMTTFPPKLQAPLDSLIPLNMQMEYLKPLSQAEEISIEGYDYIVIVYWSKFMGRQSKRLIRFVQKNYKLSTDKKVRIIYANTDNLFVME